MARAHQQPCRAHRVPASRPGRLPLERPRGRNSSGPEVGMGRARPPDRVLARAGCEVVRKEPEQGGGPLPLVAAPDRRDRMERAHRDARARLPRARPLLRHPTHPRGLRSRSGHPRQVCAGSGTPSPLADARMAPPTRIRGDSLCAPSALSLGGNEALGRPCDLCRALAVPGRSVRRAGADRSRPSSPAHRCRLDRHRYHRLDDVAVIRRRAGALLDPWRRTARLPHGSPLVRALDPPLRRTAAEPGLGAAKRARIPRILGNRDVPYSGGLAPALVGPLGALGTCARLARLRRASPSRARPGYGTCPPSRSDPS